MLLGECVCVCEEGGGGVGGGVDIGIIINISCTCHEVFYPPSGLLRQHIFQFYANSAKVISFWWFSAPFANIQMGTYTGSLAFSGTLHHTPTRCARDDQYLITSFRIGVEIDRRD